MMKLDMDKVARRGLIVVVVVGFVLITAAMGLTARKSGSLETTGLNGSQNPENVTIKEPDNSGAQGIQKADKGKYKLLVHIEPFASAHQEGHRLNLTVRNESRSVIYVVERVTLRDFKIEIKDYSGKIVMPREDRRKGLILEEGRQALVRIKAGREVSYIVNLLDLYDLVSGEYVLIVKKVIFLRDKRTIVEVESAPVNLLVPQPTI